MEEIRNRLPAREIAGNGQTPPSRRRDLISHLLLAVGGVFGFCVEQKLARRTRSTTAQDLEPSSDGKLIVPVDRRSLCSSRLSLIVSVLASSCVLVGVASTESSMHSAQAQSTRVCQSPVFKASQPPVLSADTIALSGNASVTSPAHGKADGYCLYRSPKQSDASPENKCKERELLNRAPLPGTTCVDNAVTDGPIYYYAVAAVNAVE